MLSKSDKGLIFENAISWIIVFGMLVYGVSKIVQFNGAADFDINIKEMTNMQLMWAFYARSKSFVITLGILEVTAGLLIFFRKTRLLGCFFASTILVNIILQDIFYDVHRGALLAAMLYQSLILVILFKYRSTIQNIFRTLITYHKPSKLNSKFFINLFLAFLLFIIFRIVEYYVTIVLL